MVPKLAHPAEADARGATRASLYLAAALYCDGFSSPVKIRNISSTGALLEGNGIPGIGTMVQLVRGGLIVHGLVAWADEERCGLKFSGRVDVAQWRAAPGHGEQQRVDDIVRLVKAGAVPLPVPSLSPISASEQRDPNAELPDDLRRACELLDSLGAMLASDAEIVAKHGTALQNLDIATQVIAAVESMIASPANIEIDRTKLVALRRSADQALRQGASKFGNVGSDS